MVAEGHLVVAATDATEALALLGWVGPWGEAPQQVGGPGWGGYLGHGPCEGDGVDGQRPGCPEAPAEAQQSMLTPIDQQNDSLQLV